MIQVTLMNKNRPVANVWGENQKNSDKNAFPRFHASQFEYINPAFCPILICSQSQEKTTHEFNEWMRKRVTSGKRQNLPREEQLKWDNLTPHYFNLNDQYWLRYSKDETWDALNFFTNDWNLSTGEEIFHHTCRLAKRGFQDFHISTDCPEVSTPGIASKRWIIKDGTRCLIKEPAEKNETEVIVEILASKLLQARQSSFPDFVQFVDYFPYIANYQVCSGSQCFVTPSVELVTAYDLCYALPKAENEKNSLPSIAYYDHLKKAVRAFRIPHGEEYIQWVIGIDKWLGNPDRHLCNLCFIRNAETGKFLGPAPVFDFGQAYRSEAKVHYIFERSAMDIFFDIPETNFTEIQGILEPLGYSNKHIRTLWSKIDTIQKILQAQIQTRPSF